MSLTVQVRYRGNVRELTARFPCLSFLTGQAVPRTPRRRWARGGGHSFDAQVLFAGKSGYGKSTTANRVVGRDVFDCGDIEPCTRLCQSADFRLARGSYLSIGDVPGIGESEAADAHYLRAYGQFAAKADVVVYVLRADQRDLAVDERAFATALAPVLADRRVLIGLNFADRIGPAGPVSGVTTGRQRDNLRAKAASVAARLDVPVQHVIAYSAATGYGVGRLVAAVAGTLERELKTH